MICYRDMTFCKSDCTNFKCPRKLTHDVISCAEQWWRGNNPPIAITDFSSKCPEYTPTVDEDG